MKDYQETYVTFIGKVKEEQEVDGKTVEVEVDKNKVLPEAKFEKLDPKPEPLKIQSCGFHEVETVEEAQTLYGADLINIVNRGGILKQQNAARTLMLDDDFATVEGVYDLAPICAELTERTKMTPVEKAAKSLAKLSPEEIAALLAQFAPAAA